MKKQSILSCLSACLSALFMVMTLSSQLYAIPLTAPTVSIPLVGVPVIQSNLNLDYTGNTNQLVSYGDAKASYSVAIGSTNTPRANFGAGNVLTPQALRGGFRSTGSNIARNGYISALSSQVSSLNSSGIAVIATNNLGSTMAKAGSVVPNPDKEDTDLDGGDQENGAPLGDAIPLLLLMAGAYVLIIHRKKHASTATE